MILTFAHYKGGTGKTTSCLSVAGWLAKNGKRVLVVDLDPQGNATTGLGIEKSSLDDNMFHVMNKRKEIKEIILETDIENLHIAPANSSLGKINLVSYEKDSDARILLDVLEKVRFYYDYILIFLCVINSITD